MAAKPWIVVPLVLPVGDKEYTVQPVEFKLGLSLIAVFNGESSKLDAKPNEVLFKMVMGPAWDEMLADKQPFPVMFRAGMSATQYQVALLNDMSFDDAVRVGEDMWNSGIDPEAVAAALAAANMSKTPTSKPSTSTAKAKKTPPRASTPRTTSPTATRPDAPKKTAPRSNGTR